jgi:ATP-binding cassette subfamily C protein
VPQGEQALDLLDEAGLSAQGDSDNLVPQNLLSHREPARVEMANVHFSYPNSNNATISNLSMVIEPGQQVALIGESGAGKSTIADLILGLLTPGHGTVRINGKIPADLMSTNPGYLGYVPQKPGLISGTIEANIALGVPKSEIDTGRLTDAIQGAYLTDVIDALPDGVEADIGKRKDELSGGQLQRIGLARALYSQPGLLILDEATNALDAESELEIRNALKQIRGQVTVIVIAHHFNIIQDTDFAFHVTNGAVEVAGLEQRLNQDSKKPK